MSMAKVVMTLVKLAFALAVLAVGWMMLSPATTATWPLSGPVQSGVAILTKAFPVQPVVWPVVVLVFGAACLLAALPYPAKARSRRRAAARTAAGPFVLGGLHDGPTIAATPVLHASEPDALDPFPGATPVLQEKPEVVIDPFDPPQAEAVPSLVEEASEPKPVAEVAPEPIVPAEPLTLEEEIEARRATLAASGAVADRSRLADLLKKQGDVAESEGRLEEAMRAYEASVAERRTVLVATPEDAREQRWLWTTLESLAECREDRGHRSRAAALFRESVSAGIRAVALAPQEAHYPSELEATRARLAALEAQLAL